MENSHDIITAIVRGELDDNLDGIYRAIEERRRIASRVNFHSLKAGDAVRLVNLRPLYLVGAPATVVEHHQTRISIRIDEEWLAQHPQARSRWSGVVKASPDMLEPVQ